MKKLQVLTLSMLLSAGYMLQSSADGSSGSQGMAGQGNYGWQSHGGSGMAGQGGGGFNGGGLKPTAAQQADMAARKASMATKKSADEARIDSEMGSPVTNASIAAFVNTIATDISTATAADAVSIFASLRDAEFAFNTLYPQPKSAHKKKGKGDMKDKGDMKKRGGKKSQQTAPVTVAPVTPAN